MHCVLPVSAYPETNHKVRICAVSVSQNRSRWPRGLRHGLFALSNAGIVGSNPTQGMLLFCVLMPCV
jgi:hypothetical protein